MGKNKNIITTAPNIEIVIQTERIDLFEMSMNKKTKFRRISNKHRLSSKAGILFSTTGIGKYKKTTIQPIDSDANNCAVATLFSALSDEKQKIVHSVATR